MRKDLSYFEIDFDDFDKFFFKSLFYFFPKSLLEQFEEKIIFYNCNFNNLPKLKYLISEAWISDENTSFAIAILKNNDVKLVYNEHNYLGYPFLGNNLKDILKLVFKYFTLGWRDKHNEKIEASGSLFESLSSVKTSYNKKTIDILFVSSVPGVKTQDFNGSYGESGSENVLNYFKFLNSFFKSLELNVLKKIYFRAYPKRFTRNWLVWDQKYELRNFVDYFMIYDELGEENIFDILPKTKLVVISYLSTSYLESLMSNTPTIILINKKNYFFEKKNKNFFKDLLDVSICFEDQKKAAMFINTIAEDPLGWWLNKKVQDAKNKFINNNIKSDKSMLNKIFNLVD